jgi:hypothetical protein
MKRNFEIDDTLQERVDNAIEETRDMLVEYIKENKPDKTPCLHNDLDYDGRFHEIIDGAVPIYTKEIDDTWYLHKRDLIEAYENAGVGTDATENDGMSAIYFYIYEQVCKWYNDNADEVFEEVANGQEMDS